MAAPIPNSNNQRARTKSIQAASTNAPAPQAGAFLTTPSIHPKNPFTQALSPNQRFNQQTGYATIVIQIHDKARVPDPSSRLSVW
jgi:hypothetical protein